MRVVGVGVSLLRFPDSRWRRGSGPGPGFVPGPGGFVPARRAPPAAVGSRLPAGWLGLWGPSPEGRPASNLQDRASRGSWKRRLENRAGRSRCLRTRLFHREGLPICAPAAREALVPRFTEEETRAGKGEVRGQAVRPGAAGLRFGASPAGARAAGVCLVRGSRGGRWAWWAVSGPQNRLGLGWGLRNLVPAAAPWPVTASCSPGNRARTTAQGVQSF